jgi:hypothetical protein
MWDDGYKNIVNVDASLSNPHTLEFETDLLSFTVFCRRDRPNEKETRKYSTRDAMQVCFVTGIISSP